LSNPDNPLVPVKSGRHALSIARHEATLYYRHATRPMSVLSVFILGMGLIFAFGGLYRFALEHGQAADTFRFLNSLTLPTIPFEYFISAFVLMILYAWGYVSYIKHRLTLTAPSFDGGLLSARWVISLISLLVSLSFMVVGYEILILQWANAWVGIYCQAMIPITCACFACVYKFYCKGSGAMDMLSAGSSRRRQLGRETIIALGITNFVSSLYYIGFCLVTSDSSWTYAVTAYAAVSSSWCFLTYFLFAENLNSEEDRGVFAG